MKDTAILQPLIPHYRQEFFKGILKKVPCDIFCYSAANFGSRQNFKSSDIVYKNLWSKEVKGFLWYNPRPFLSERYTTLVLMLNFGHLTTWFLLLTKFIHKKRIILWGHGISVKRYIKEEKTPDFLLRTMISLSDGVWFYTEQEKKMWSRIFPNKQLTSLSNTISEVELIIEEQTLDKMLLKQKHGIQQEKILIFCARFNNADRRTDLLVKLIGLLDNKLFGFIIVGGGTLKPDFNGLSNVYDYGEVYDRNLKNELFNIADIYFQPAWVGLSIVEAMAYGKPIFTFKRSPSLLQCVEYSYIEHGKNGLIFDNIDSLISNLEILSTSEIDAMGNQARYYVKANLMSEKMVTSALSSLNNI